jgi:phosphoribosylformylglycinamidine synthase
VFGSVGDEPPDVDDPALLRGFFAAIQELNRAGIVSAYHDRSDGGLVVTLLEMAFASAAGLDIDIAALVGAAGREGGDEDVAALFNEELGAVIQVSPHDRARLREILGHHGLTGLCHRIGSTRADGRVRVVRSGHVVIDHDRVALRRLWSETTHLMQRLRDDPECADEEHEARCDAAHQGLTPRATFDLDEDVAAPFVLAGRRPRVAILREQGVNGHIEMAAAFHHAGFDAVDVHMSDVLAGEVALDGFNGLVACGGFSYGDVLGAGEGWAKSILYHPRARDAFAAFFARTDRFALGVCNGCQMLATLRELIPGAASWPRFVRNRSEQFEARLSLVRVEPSPSLFFRGMEGSVLPVAVAHGEGRAELAGAGALERLERDRLVAARFVDHRHEPALRYPANPNGSPGGVTALTTPDGRATILMPHPERTFRAVQLSWRPDAWQNDGPFMRMFRNARAWVG